MKIFTSARILIMSIMAELSTKHGFSNQETSWKTLVVEEKLVVFEIHERIMNLLKKEAAILRVKKSKLSFCEKTNGFWEVTVTADEAESYFFSRLLFMALARIQSGTVNARSINLAIIERHTVQASMKIIGDVMGFVPKANFSAGQYRISVPIAGMTIEFHHKDIDILCKQIGLQLRGFFPKNGRRQK